MVDPNLTRRRLFQTGAGAVAAAAAARVGLPSTASAGRPAPWNQYLGRFQNEVRLFAGKYVPVGWKRAPVDARALLGSGEVPGGRDYKVDDRGDGAARRAADGGAATLALTGILIDDPSETSDLLMGEVRAFPFDIVPRGWHLCDGRKLEIQNHSALYTVIANVFPSDHRTWFALPDLRDRTPIAAGDATGIPDAPAGSERGDLAAGDSGRQPRLHLNFCICEAGDFPLKP
jgi:microcystin-dependent protein